jgi:DNA invertase Pin-like site-specific DNA recombinase
MGSEKLATRNPTNKLVLTVLAGVATWDREVTLERLREGIAKAERESKYKVCQPTVAVQPHAIKTMHASDSKPAPIARRLGIARSRRLQNVGRGRRGRLEGKSARLPAPPPAREGQWRLRAGRASCIVHADVSMANPR